MTEWAKTNIKTLLANAVVAEMDARDVAKNPKKADMAEQAKQSGNAEGDFRLVNSDTHTPFDSLVFSIRNQYHSVYEICVDPTVHF